DRVDRRHRVGDVAELERADPGLAKTAFRKAERVEQLDLGSLRILECEHAVGTRRAPGPDHRADAATLELALCFLKREFWRDFECQALEAGLLAIALQHDALEAVLGRQHRARCVTEGAM